MVFLGFFPDMQPPPPALDSKRTACLQGCAHPATRPYGCLYKLTLKAQTDPFPVAQMVTPSPIPTTTHPSPCPRGSAVSRQFCSPAQVDRERAGSAGGFHGHSLSCPNPSLPKRKVGRQRYLPHPMPRRCPTHIYPDQRLI